MKNYQVLLHEASFARVDAYLNSLKSGGKAGKRLQVKLNSDIPDDFTVEELLEDLINTKDPQIFAESVVVGDGSDWNLAELSILGDISIATPITVFDNGAHRNPVVHEKPFLATLLFVPGALLRNGCNFTPADWGEVVLDRQINSQGYFSLYERRLLPLFAYTNEICREKGKRALITIPGLGCGQFAGPFAGKLGLELQSALKRILEVHGSKFPFLKAVYYDPFNECENKRFEINGISFMVRPLLKGNEGKSQLCQPIKLADKGDDFTNCELFSMVAWDHVSWPGNDFYGGSRATDDGVKAAATDSMSVMTGVEGSYNQASNCYEPPKSYSNWGSVVAKNKLKLEVGENLRIFG